MHICRLCHKKVQNDNLTFFKIPKDEQKRKEWSEICGIQLTVNDGLCGSHFSSSDIIKGRHKVLLAPDAVPLMPPIKSEENLSSTNLDCSPEYVCINSIYNKVNQKCRCCTSPSSSFVQIGSRIKSGECSDKTYKDLLYEILNLSIPIHHENILPQQICVKCGAQLKNSYKFIQQACQVYHQYLKLLDKQNIQEDIKNIEYLRESPIEIAEAFCVENADEELKIEPLIIEQNIDIKKEKVECEIFGTKALNNQQFLEERDFSNTDDHSSENEEDSDEPESVKDSEVDLNNETIAICCDICHKVYRNAKFLKIHKRYTHMPDENKLPCPLCSYKVSRTSALKVHIGLVHGHDKVNEYFKPAVDSNKKYPCSLCPRSYGRKDSLRKHTRIKHHNKSAKEEETKKTKSSKPKEKQCFLCTFCGQSYNSIHGLKSHTLTHTRERPFSCEICDKTFKRLKDLQLHRVIHSDEKPHQCSECGKAFKRADKLKLHMRVHSQLRPYKCNECEKTFKYSSVLRTHMHIHTGKTPFTCKTCGETFSLRTSLNYHCLKNGHAK